MSSDDKEFYVEIAVFANGKRNGNRIMYDISKKDVRASIERDIKELGFMAMHFIDKHNLLDK